MATRFGRRSADGTYEYHDSKDSLVVAHQRERSEERASLFGLLGLSIGGLIAYGSIHKWGSADLPKWIRFAIVIAGAGLGSYVLAKCADWIWLAMKTLLLLGLLYGIGTFVWKAV